MSNQIDKLQARIKAERAKVKAQEKRARERMQEALGRALINNWKESPEVIAILDSELSGSARKLFGLTEKPAAPKQKPQNKISKLFAGTRQ